MKDLIFKLGVCAVICSGLLLFYTTGCGQQASTPTPTPTVGTVTISGSINTGVVANSAAVSAAGVKTQAIAQSALADYSVAAVSENTGAVYFASAKTDSSGNFSISGLPSGESYYIEILDSSNKLAAPVALGSSGGDPVMALDPGVTSTVNLGQIVYDSSKNAAAPITAPTSYLDLTASVDAKSGESLVPKGAGNFGKGSEQQFSGTYDPNTVDGDKDGLPNLFDADNNGDLVVDELDGLYTMEALTTQNAMIFAFTNLKVDYNNRNTFNTNYDEFNIAIGASPMGKGPQSATKIISDVKLVEGPPWITKAKAYDGNFNNKNSAQLWSAANYSVTNNGIQQIFLTGLKPGADVKAGDVLKFRVTYSDSSTEDVIKMINFAFTDIPQVQAIKIGNGAWQEQPLTFPTSAGSSEIRVRWLRPKDENNNEVLGGRYTFEYNSTAGNAIETEVITKDAGAAGSLEASCNFLTLPNASLTGNMLIGVCIRSAANDNAAENVWFNKGW